MSIFEGLEAFGFTEINEQSLYKKPNTQTSAKDGADKPVPKAEDYLFQKAYNCPVCDNNFTETTAIKGKLRYVNSHSDLRPCYEPIDPMYYDIIMCNKCGYAAMMSVFSRIAERQCDLIESIIMPKFKPKTYPLVLDTDMAIERYKMALYNALVKEARSGEKAYLCLKLAWLYRDKEDQEKEKMYMQNAYEGLRNAYENDSFPICGLDEPTVSYIIGELARRVGEYSNAMKWIGNVVLRKNLNPRLKERASIAKDMIREDMKNAAQAKK